MKDDFWRGIKFGYPLCCIIFYCDYWHEKALRKIKMFHGRPEVYDWETKKKVGHIQCPECIIKNVRRIK